MPGSHCVWPLPHTCVVQLLARRNKQRRERALVTRALMQAQQDAHQANKQRHMERT